MFNTDKKIFAPTFIFILVLFGFLIYSNTLYSPFIFDDLWYIESNPVIRDLSNFTNFLYTPIYGAARFVSLLTFAVNYYFCGLNTFGYHLVNIAIHIINAILVYYFAILTFTLLSLRGALAPKQSQNEIAPKFIAFSVALIFLVHPIQTQAVTYITQRATSLATLFYMLALVLYVKARLKGEEMKRIKGEKEFYLFTSLPFYLLSLISAILAMKTKEMSFTLPFIIILYEFTFFNNGSRTRPRFLYLIPYLLTLVIIPLDIILDIFFVGSGRIADAISDLSRYDYLITQFNVIVTYIRLLFFPADQHFGYDYPIAKSIFEIKTFLSFAFLLSLFSFAISLFLRSRKTNNGRGLLTSFGILWFFITLSIESSVIPIKQVIFEHRLYLPSIGFILSVVAAYYYLLNYMGNKIVKTILFSIIIMTIFSLAFAAYKRNNIYKDELDIWLNEVKYSPKGMHNYNELGRAYFNKNMLDEAERAFKKAIELDPLDFESAYAGSRLAVVYERKGLFDAAEKEYRASIRLLKYANMPEVFGGMEAQIHVSLGDIYYKKQLLEKALAEYKESVILNPLGDVYNKTGVVYLKMGNLDAAIDAFKEAINLDPYFITPYANMGFAYFDKGDYDKAMEMHKKALKISPKFANAHYGFGEVYEKKGIKDKAVWHYKEYIKHADPKEQFVERAKKKIAELGAE